MLPLHYGDPSFLPIEFRVTPPADASPFFLVVRIRSLLADAQGKFDAGEGAFTDAVFRVHVEQSL